MKNSKLEIRNDMNNGLKKQYEAMLEYHIESFQKLIKVLMDNGFIIKLNSRKDNKTYIITIKTI